MRNIKSLQYANNRFMWWDQKSEIELKLFSKRLASRGIGQNGSITKGWEVIRNVELVRRLRQRGSKEAGTWCHQMLNVSLGTSWLMGPQFWTGSDLIPYTLYPPSQLELAICGKGGKNNIFIPIIATRYRQDSVTSRTEPPPSGKLPQWMSSLRQHITELQNILINSHLPNICNFVLFKSVFN